MPKPLRKSSRASKLNDNGRIINISSVATRTMTRNQIVYNMSKAALEMFTKTLAKDVGRRGITVNSVGPGITLTETVAKRWTDPEKRKGVDSMTLLGRFGEPSDIADFVHALASPAGRWVTAQNIEASGGLQFL
jgi:NAD(P)-dependent dehydrogenase (short-subunit alcohol dehydrogenase family)